MGPLQNYVILSLSKDLGSGRLPDSRIRIEFKTCKLLLVFWIAAFVAMTRLSEGLDQGRGFRTCPRLDRGRRGSKGDPSSMTREIKLEFSQLPILLHVRAWSVYRPRLGRSPFVVSLSNHALSGMRPRRSTPLGGED